MAATHLTLSINDWPEALWQMRHALAQILRAEADGEPAIVRDKLLRIAAAFETAQIDDDAVQS